MQLEVSFNNGQDWFRLATTREPDPILAQEELEQVRDRWIIAGPAKYASAQYQINPKSYMTYKHEEPRHEHLQ